MATSRRPALFRRRPALPKDARTALGLDRGSRVLAWSPLFGGGWVAATSGRLCAVLPTGVLVDRPWTEVDHAAWGGESGMLAVWWVGSRQPTALEVEPGSTLPGVVRERVQASLVLTRELELPDGSILRIALRRADDGALSTQVAPGPGARSRSLPKDPEAAALIDRAVAELREEAGLPPRG